MEAASAARWTVDVADCSLMLQRFTEGRILVGQQRARH
jgi:hypothetical protein